MLAIVFSHEKFHQYTFGRPFVVRRDHKPLQSILKKSLTSAPRRLQGMTMRLQKYNTEVHYECGKKMYIAHLLSCAYFPPGGGTPIYGLYRYVPRDRVWFLRFSILKWGISFAPVGIVFPV